jgi:hypothetical protein
MADDWAPVTAAAGDDWQPVKAGPKGVEVPEHIPEAFLRRFSIEPDPVENLEKTAGPGLASRVLGAIYEGGAAGFGESPTGLSPDDAKRLQKLGIFQDPEAARDITSGIRFANEAMIRPAYSAIEATFRSINAGIYAAGALGGQITAEITGANEAEQARARRDGAHLATVATLLMGSHPVARKTRGPTGEIIPEQIGTIARSEDFVAAAEVVAGEKAPMVVQEKMLASYKEKGLHPAELAHDAMTDPIVAQRLLSSEKADLPPGGPPREPPAPPRAPEPPAPPPEGSFAEAQGKILDKISVGAQATKERMSWDKFYTQAVDDLHPLKAVDEGAYDLARLTRGQFGKAEHFLEHGTYDFHTYKTNGPALKDILAPVRDDLDGVRAFLASKRAVEIEASGRKSGMDLEAAQRVISEGEGTYGKMAEEIVTYQRNGLKYLKDSGVLSDEAFTAMTEAGKSYVPFFRMMGEGEMGGGGAGKGFGPGNPVKKLKGSERDIIDPLESIIKNTYAYISIAERNAVGIKLIDALKKAGSEVASSERVQSAAVKVNDKIYTGSNHLEALEKAAKELGTDVEKIHTKVDDAKSSQFDAWVTSTGRFIDSKEAAKITKSPHKKLDSSDPEFTVQRGKPARDPELVAYLKEQGVTDPDAIVDFVKSAIPEQSGETIGAFRNGVKETVKVNDPDLVRAFHGLEQSSANMLFKVLAVPAKSLRAGAVLSPDFIVRNVTRDFMTALVNSKGFFSPIDTAKGLVSVIRKDADFLDWMKGGGANSTMVALDRAYMQESLQKLNAETGLMDRAWNVVKHPISSSLAPLRLASELAENATRLGEFKKVRGEGKEAIQAAAMASREVTLDFARIGASMRAYNMITAFGNAQIQGLDRIGRAFHDRPFNTTAKVAGGITLPSVLLWWANKDDPRVKELPAWQKDLFWIVATKDHLYRIPKPFELGVVFGSGVERILDQTVGNNPEAFDKFSKSVIDLLMPNVTPTAIQPIVEQFANRSTFSDRTLIPAGMEKHLPEYQYTPYTTELTKKLGQMISAFPGMRASAVGPGAPFGPIARTVTSPILMENYLRSWTGGLGMYALQAADVGLRKAGMLPDPVTPTPTLADIPVVKAFVVRYPSATTQSIQEFYDKHEVTKKFYDTWMAKAQEGDADAMARIQSAGGPMMFVRLDAIKETLTEHGKLVRDIYKNPTIKAEEKRQLIDSLYFNMIEIGKAGKQMMTESEKALKQATAP